MKKSVFALLALLVSFPAFAVTPFEISDIRVEGLERLDAGTIFNYLPLKVGDEMNDEEAKLAIKALFDTGFFRNVQLGQDGTVLVVTVSERPSIASVTVTGNKEIETESLEQGLRQSELIEGRIFNRASLEVVEREIQQAYLSMGRYSTRVEASVEELERNRVAVEIKIDEGRVAKIKKINIIGAEQVSVKDLKDELNLIERKGWRLFTKRNQYSRQKLEADVEQIRSYYLDRGFHDFEVVSTNVDISPNKQNIFISIALEEGERYAFGDTKIEVAEEIEGLEELVTIESGEPFSRKKVNETRAAIADKYSDEGYAFVEVRPAFETDRENLLVSTVFTIDPKQRVYVRKIEISGNTYTRDEVIRREMRQFEGSWYSAASVRRSRTRLNRLGFFETVTIETPSVPGTSDQVDLRVVVVERDTGSIQLSAGYSDSDGALIGANYQQRNVLGTGREISIDINTSDAAEEISFNYVNPYYTADGISRGINLSQRKVDSSEVDTAEYILDTTSAGLKYKIPIAETNSLNLGIAYERLELEATDETPPEFLPIIEENPDSDDFVLTLGVSKDTRNDFFFPTSGGVVSLGTEVTVPGSDFEYYKINLQGAYYVPLGSLLTFKAGAGLGYGDGYGDDSEAGLPFFKNYFAGGSKSVRGYNGRSLGPKDSGATPEPTGGDRRVLVNTEFLLPAYGEGASKDKRLGVFVDGGQVWGTGEDVELDDMRYSAGVVFNWFSPVGPFALSYGEPLNEEEGDDIENFQISFGTVFR
ncbi:MAG: outer membrane protein assembly factor BamA [bacterium]